MRGDNSKMTLAVNGAGLTALNEMTGYRLAKRGSRHLTPCVSLDPVPAD